MARSREILAYLGETLNGRTAKDNSDRSLLLYSVEVGLVAGAAASNTLVGGLTFLAPLVPLTIEYFRQVELEHKRLKKMGKKTVAEAFPQAR